MNQLSGNQPWEELEHTADWALKVRGSDLKDLFENAARGMISLIGGEVDSSQDVIRRHVSVAAPEQETLLVDWLTELLYLIEDEGFVVASTQIQKLDNTTLVAEISGHPRGRMTKHIKAVTYHNLSIQETDQGYQTVIVFDV